MKLGADEGGDSAADLLAFVLLQEVAGTADDLGFERTGNVRGDALCMAGREDRVGVGEEDEGGLLPACQLLADGEVCGSVRVVGRDRHELGEREDPGLRLR